MRADNEALSQQAEALAKEKAGVLQQAQELTARWQASVSENAALNRENIQLRNTLSHLNAMLAAGSAAPAVAPLPPPSLPQVPPASTGPTALLQRGLIGPSGVGAAVGGSGAFRVLQPPPAVPTPLSSALPALSPLSGIGPLQPPPRERSSETGD